MISVFFATSLEQVHFQLFSAAAFKAGKIQSNPFAHGSAGAEQAITGHPGKGVAIPPPASLGMLSC